MIDWELFYNSLRKPDFLPGYEVQNRLGGGAFGDVYKARKRSIGKVYAVKFLKVADDAQGDVVGRELEQVRYFASIDHPNLVTIEDMGVVMGVPFVIMGYAGEDTLARRLQRGDLERADAMRFFVQACRGVLALHDRRLAHFDLKPSNVFLKGDVARVGDYGLAKLLADGRQTLSFGRGTPHYMAPEMLKNRADHRADIYSLGVILYESLAHRLPFGTEGGLAGCLREEDEPPAFPDDFPVPLRSVVERALRVDPDQRFWSVHELLEEMGQTARQGDSVRFRALGLEAGAGGAADGRQRGPGDAGGPGRAAPEAAAGDGEGRADEPTPADDLRRTAAELARGAVGVARSVWDGMTSRSSETPRSEPGGEGVAAVPGGAPGAAGAARAGLGADVVSFRTLDEPDEDRPGSAAGEPGAGAGSSARAEGDEPSPLLAVLARERERRQGGAGDGGAAALAPGRPGAGSGSGEAADRDPRAESGFSPWEALPRASALHRGRTVPVPPATEGGIPGTLAATLVLGIEVMVAVASGPIFYLLRSIGRGVDRVFRSVPGAFGTILKLAIFLLLLALLGALAAALVIFAL